MKIIVIGAGLSGLTAALRLRQRGHEVLVVEAQAHAGGRCKAVRRDGFLIDTCPELAASSYRRWLALIDEVGLGGELVDCPSVMSMLRDGRLIDIDLAKPWTLAATPLLSWRAKLALLRGLWRLRGPLRAVPHYLLDDVRLDDPHNNARAVAMRAFGAEVTDLLLEPLLRPIGGVTLDMMSSLMVPYTLSDWSRMVTLRGGLDSLPKALAERLPVRYGSSVHRVHADSAGVRLDVHEAGGGTAELRADKCLITAPYDQAEAMYPRLAELAGDYRQTMQFMRMIDVKLAYGRPTRSRAACVMLSTQASRDINVVSLAHNKCADRAPPGHALFSVFTEHKEYARLAAMADDDLVAMLAAQVEALYPEVRGALLFSRVARQERVSYVPDAGFFHRTRRLWDAVGTDPRVQLGGDIFMFGGMEAAVASGERAAARLAQAH
ncbi:protoporphyrinogen/coproporphyrinogen oxidase [Piscinibacter sp.]|uniref:protoporphyrinogen/coproporphyrinogen oxidase n=1 Tax=Piscinibacter sp. TaxID=1903157 RepID=UPI0039E47DD3